jgi:hypothetical protein
MHVTPPESSPEQPQHYAPPTPPPGYGPPYAPQPWPYQGPPAVADPSVKRTNRRNWIILGAVGLAALVVLIVTVAMTATPTRQATGGSTYKPIYDNNGAAPVAPVTTGPTYANPTDADFKLTPKITQKQCFGSAGCNVTFTVDLSYVGKGAKPNSTWDITYDAVGTEDALTDTITVHVDGTGMPGTYDSHEELVQTKKTSDAITLRITAIAPGNG